MCDILPGGRRVRQRMPRHPQCFENDTATGTGRGSTGVNNPNNQAEYQRRLEASLRSAGINEAIQRFHGALLLEAGRLSANMSYERFTTLDSDPGITRRILGHVLQSTLDTIRDQALSHMLPPLFMRLIGSPLTYLTGFQSVYDQSRWESRDESRRNAFRTQQVYARSLWIYASSAAGGNLDQATQNNIILVRQGLQYLRWKDEDLPRLEAWVRQNIPASERGPTIGLPTTGTRRR